LKVFNFTNVPDCLDLYFVFAHICLVSFVDADWSSDCWVSRQIENLINIGACGSVVG
jgi:hypothetical protein